MNKFLIIIGIPLFAIIGFVIVENPKLWWLAFAVLFAVPRFLMSRIRNSSGKSLLKDTAAFSSEAKMEPEAKRIEKKL